MRKDSEVKLAEDFIRQSHGPNPKRNVNGKDVPFTGQDYDDFVNALALDYLGKFWQGLRAERDRLLAATDWTQIPDAPVDPAAWAKYRQALRDLPAKIKDPTAEVAWPEPPK